jgi:hypothetical protein
MRLNVVSSHSRQHTLLYLPPHENVVAVLKVIVFFLVNKAREPWELGLQSNLFINDTPLAVFKLQRWMKSSFTQC